MDDKNFFRCSVCNDIHIGVNAPEKCPTCMQLNAYVRIDKRELFNILDLKGDIDPEIDKENIISVWDEFSSKNDFKLNPDKKHVETVAKGVCENDSDSGFKLCPCRLRDGTRKRDIELICPCNFKIQDKWKEKGECWCGLFVKR